MLSVIGHEIAELATNPLVNAWYARQEPVAPVEIADFCEGIYGTGGGGSYTGQMLNDRDGRLITDNILVAYELLHCFKNRKYGRVGSFALKLDMRFIIRNELGLIMGFGVKSQPDFVLVFLAEARVVRHGLLFAAKLGFQLVTLESDSRTVIHKIKELGDDYSELQPVIWDIKAIALRFVCCRFSFSPRSSSQAAHAMASYGKKVVVDSFWIEEAPQEVSTFIDADRRNKPLT
ncbi:hypothetical protein F3Y22_tig00110429pilonHSYRG00660 [Hibiscus syriacus]|uniref:RNase H type-1 domain-containing protein n=1 Tax=Hibiscus syriacus TaxID=106335 RepID=A0A6A3AL50_HIBSY|nr:hypothetical protein F3Y22_tig00110429pilonHSYRG00660 [Hibiscus syriacus]